MTDHSTSSWREVWARLLAFRQHLPDHYEIEESSVRQYHSMVDELESSASDLSLRSFRVSPEDVRPKVVSVRRPTRSRPGRTNYSHDSYCLRSALLMKLDALIQFLGPRGPSPSARTDQLVPLVASDTDEVNAGLRVFLCHALGDKATVRSLYRKLKADGFTPWLDEENILPGQDWDNEIRRAVRASHVVVVCLSTSSITKEGYVQKEIKSALDVADEKPPGTIFLIPARLELCDLPERLRRWQCVDLFDSRGYERLVAALEKRQAQIHNQPDAAKSSGRAVQPLVKATHEPPLPLAEKMRRALKERGADEDAARIRLQREVELREAARKAGPTQFDTLCALLRARGDALNGEKLPGFPQFKYAQVNHRLDAGKYAIELLPYAAIDSFSVDLLVGLHPNAAQFLAEVPDIPTRRERLSASMDQDEFCWRDSKGQKCDVNQVLENAMETLCSLILEDLERR